jgi:hypothetical protein
MNTVKLIYVIDDCGDGSQRNVYFSSEEAAENWIETTDFYGGPIPDGVEVDTFTVLPNGVLKPIYGFED